MPANAGTAYVQIVPSAKGIKGKITDVLKGESQTAGESSGSTIGSALVSNLKGVITAGGIGAFLGASLTQGGALQQSLGGVETLFKDNADTVKKYASQAFKTAGVSANEYMNNVTSFSASLISSLGGNTAKAADVANMAMIDMSDNVNKMGSDMESVQNAYQGFAKQNYTMLDNLKLGYGGTKSEMERLLQDAQKLTGVKYDINNLSDVYEAIHAIQENLGITGTTAKEASTTLTGSFGAMKAAAKDFLGNLSIGADITVPMSNLVKTTSTFIFGNLLPMVGNIIVALPQAVVTGISQAVPALITGLGSMLTQIGTFFTTSVPGLGTQVSSMIVQAVSTIALQLPAFMEQGKNVIDGLVSGIVTNFPIIMSEIQTMVTTMLTCLLENLPSFMETGLELILYLVQGIVSCLPTVVESISNTAISMLNTLLNKMPEFLAKGIEIIKNIATGILQSLPSILSTLLGILVNLVNLIASHLPDFLGKGVQILIMVGTGLLQAVPQLLGVIPGILAQAAGAFFSYDWFSIGSNIISGIVGGIRAAGGAIGSALMNIAKSAFNSVKSFLGIKSPSRKAKKEIGQFIPQGAAAGVEEDDSLIIAMRNLGKRAMQSARTSLNFGDIRNVAKFKVDPGKNTTGIPQGPVTNFYQTINSAKELSPYEMEIRTQAMLKRSVWA